MRPIGMGHRALPFLLLATVLSVFPTLSRAAEPLPRTEGEQVLDIASVAELSDVTSALCQSAGLRCSGLEHLKSYNVVPMLLRGGWHELLANLTSGVAVNYQIRYDADGVVEVSFFDVLPEVNREANGTQEAAAFASPSERQIDAGIDESAEWQQRELAAAMFVVDARRASYDGTGVQPFPDQFGNPIPATSKTPAFLPFPDHFGRPIPVHPSISGNPFPPSSVKH